jgi:hypothetical protein
MLRTSERAAYKACAWAWHHEYTLGLRLLNPRPNAADFGSGLHHCLAEWYIPGKKRGVHPVKTWREWMAGQHGQFVRIDDLSDPEHDGQAKFEDAYSLGEEILTNYVEEWGKDRSWTILAPEQRFSVIIRDPKTNRPLVRYVGTVDGFYRDNDTGIVFILETKSTNKNLDRFLLDTQWSEQFGGYDLVATEVCHRLGFIKPNESVQGITYNLLRRAKQDDRPVGPDGRRHNKPVKAHYIEALGSPPKDAPPFAKWTIADLESLATERGVTVLGEVSARQPTAYFKRETFSRTDAERESQLKRLAEEAKHMALTRAGKIPLLKNPTMDCSWKCRYFELCKIDENGDDYEWFRDSVYETVDPYADHRRGAANSKTGKVVVPLADPPMPQKATLQIRRGSRV